MKKKRGAKNGNYNEMIFDLKGSLHVVLCLKLEDKGVNEGCTKKYNYCMHNYSVFKQKRNLVTRL